MTCPHCGKAIQDAPPTSLDEIKSSIVNLPRDDRAALRPWLLAKFDARGYWNETV